MRSISACAWTQCPAPAENKNKKIKQMEEKNKQSSKQANKQPQILVYENEYDPCAPPFLLSLSVVPFDQHNALAAWIEACRRRSSLARRSLDGESKQLNDV